MPSSTIVELTRHPASAGKAARRIVVTIDHRDANGLSVHYRLQADMDRLLVPTPSPPDRSDGLWRHTCFEAFVQPAGAEGYLEFNFSPSCAWAAYGFEGRRQGMRNLELPCPPRIVCSLGAGQLDLHVALPAGPLPGGSTRLGLSAVVEDRDGALAWWALKHPAGPPDFHDPQSFTLQVATTGPASAASVT